MPYPPFTRQATTFGEIEHTAWLTPFCRACRRKGRYAVARLIERYGRDGIIMFWKGDFARACPLWTGPESSPCEIHVDELIRNFGPFGTKGLDQEPF